MLAPMLKLMMSKLSLLSFSFLALTSASSLQAENWSEIRFGQLPLTKDFSLSGKLKSGVLFFSEKVDFEFTIRKEPFKKHEALDPYNFQTKKHPIFYKINGIECLGATVLVTEDEMGEDIAYSALVSWDGDARQRPEGCPYSLQIDLGPGEEDSKEFYAEVTIYPTNDLSDDESYKGTLRK